MKFHAVQYNATLHDWKRNRLEVEKLMSEIEFFSSDFVVLQEMTDTGWSMKLDRITGIGTLEWACKLSAKYNCYLQVGWTDCDGDRGKNCVTICSPNGKPIGTYTKVFTCNPMRENEYFDAGNELLIFDLGECKVCPLICYDLRFPELWRKAALVGVDVFTLSSSWPEKRIAHWETLLRARAIENQAFVVAANRTGKDAVSLWGGNSMIISHMGDVICQGSETETEIISANIDAKLAHQWQNEFNVLKDLREALIGSFKVTKIKA
jgi:omega-amidase